ncbi:MAG: Uma2 family endonuclease [Candidatus Binatia bacterium]
MSTTATDAGFDVNGYFALIECGTISPDDRVELLEGQIVSMAPPSPLHDAVVYHIQQLLASRLPPGTLVRPQMTFLAGPKSVPEPDVAIVPGRNTDYLRRHPSKVHLLVEVADSSLVQDRLTKSAIYARAGVPAFWIVNLRDSSVECFTEPDQVGRRYGKTMRAMGSTTLVLPAYPDVVIEAAQLFPFDTDE